MLAIHLKRLVKGADKYAAAAIPHVCGLGQHARQWTAVPHLEPVGELERHELRPVQGNERVRMPVVLVDLFQPVKLIGTVRLCGLTLRVSQMPACMRTRKQVAQRQSAIVSKRAD
jgi:hypothetical protein